MTTCHCAQEIVWREGMWRHMKTDSVGCDEVARPGDAERFAAPRERSTPMN